jgi:hypothetical protein
VLNNLILVRNRCMKITQIPLSKISKADRIKKLQSDNKSLFGAKIKEKKVKGVKPAVTESLPVEEPQTATKKHDISSEIYWTCHHVPEVQDFTKKTKKTSTGSQKKKKTKTDEIAEGAEIKVSTKKKKSEEVSDVPKTATKVKAKQKEENQELESKQPAQDNQNEVPLKLLKEDDSDVSRAFKDKLLDVKFPFKMVDSGQPLQKVVKKSPQKVQVKVKVPETLTQLSRKVLPSRDKKVVNLMNNSFKSYPTEPETNQIEDEREIPFKNQQLRSIPYFPMFLNASKVISMFDNISTDKPPTFMPSVSKILQATMPAAQRQALIQWKNLKISELGLEGFEKMQQCKLRYGFELF